MVNGLRAQVQVTVLTVGTKDQTVKRTIYKYG